MNKLLLPARFLVSLLVVLLLAGCGSASDDRSFLAESGDAIPGGGGGGNTTDQPTDESGVETGTPTPSPQPTPQPDPVSSQIISSFLWKPESERNGNLVVLVNPGRVSILVTGSISETLSDSGPSNGRGTTGRGSFSGCDYGTNVTVDFFDSLGRRILTSSGARRLVIPDGCKRYEF